jgi:hypothetical protein
VVIVLHVGLAVLDLATGSGHDRDAHLVTPDGLAATPA